MKATIKLALLCLGLLSASAQAQGVYRCEIGGAVTWQGSPCEAPPAVASKSGATANAALLGTWRSDHATTMAWLRQHTKMTKKLDDLVDQRVGYMTLTFTRNALKIEIPKHPVQNDGKPDFVPAMLKDCDYSVVAAGPASISVSFVDPDRGNAYTTEYHFEGHDTMWFNMKIAGWKELDPRSREYFKRVK